MGHIQVRKIIDDRFSFAGRQWWYYFSPSFETFDKNKVNTFISRRQACFTKMAKHWNYDLNSEWTVRIFFSAKMILAASLMLESLEYCRKKNLKVAVPYLQYYSLLYSLKSLVLLLPEQVWDDGELIKQSHKKTIEIATHEIAKIAPEWTKSTNEQVSVKWQILRIKAFREMISYRAPSNGKKHGDYDFDVVPLCKIPVELAQMVSELLEDSLHKHLPAYFKPKLIPTLLRSVCVSEIEGFEFFDDEDAYRIDYLFRKYPMPTNIYHIISEGHVDDFFGSWCEDTPQEGSFDPYAKLSILFSLP